MNKNVKDFMMELADLMEKHNIEHFDSRDNGYGSAIYIHGGYFNGIWFRPNEEVTSEVLRDRAINTQDRD